MLNWLLNNFALGTIKASDFQSIAQITVAVSLAYIVAGPDASRLIQSSILRFKNLDDTLSALQSGGYPAPDTKKRQDLLSATVRFINSDAAKSAPVNASTTWFYASAALGFFILLVYCTFFADLYRFIATVGTVAAVVVTTRDAVLAARQASGLQVLACEIHRITSMYDVSISPTHSQEKLNKAAGVVAQLELQNIDLRVANKQLKAI